MMSLGSLKIACAVMVGSLSISAQAAPIDWCKFTEIKGNTMAELGKSIDSFGCSRRPARTASLQSWQCGDKSSFVVAVDTIGSPTLAIIQPKLPVDDLRRCVKSGIAKDMRFDPYNPFAIGGFTISGGYNRFDQFTEMEFMDYHAIAMTGGLSTTREFTELLFGASIPKFALDMRIEVAGMNFQDSSASDIQRALSDRQARVISIDDSSELIEVKMTPAVGMAGVKEIKIGSVNNHILSVTYTMNDEASYLEMIRAIEVKHGTSIRTDRDSDGCVNRFWKKFEDQSVAINGAYCPDGYEIFLFHPKTLDNLTIAMQKMAKSIKEGNDIPKEFIDDDNF